MHIRIIRAPWVDERHGITEGREFECIPPPPGAPYEVHERERWVMGDTGEPVPVFFSEFEEVRIA